MFFAKHYEKIYGQDGKVKQEIFYDPYHVYFAPEIACFDIDYVPPYEYGVLDGVYTPFPFNARIPEFSIGRNFEKEDNSIIYSKINYDSAGAETSRLVFRNGRAYEGINIVYDSNGHEKSTTEYHLGKIVKK